MRDEISILDLSTKSSAILSTKLKLDCMETSADRAQRSPKRIWLGVAAAVFAVVALSGVLALELLAFGPRAAGTGQASWLFWVAAIPAYFLLQFFAEAVLEGFLGASSLAVKAVPVVLIVLFYAAYFAFVT